MRTISATLRSAKLLASRLRGRRVDLYVWVVILCSLVAVIPLAGPNYFFDAHDAPHTVFFLTEFDAALRDGVWYPGWATDQALGYGYPTFLFYSPLSYYVAEGFHLLGAGKVVAIKWTWALATVGAGLAMYGYGRRVLGRLPGLLAAVVYMYVPYHLADIYVRAALAEYCAFVWMPLTLLAFHNLAKRVTARRVALAGLAYGALWLTHNVTAMAFTPLLAAYTLFRLLAERGERPQAERLVGRAGAALGGALLGLGIAAALILPNLLERRYIAEEQWVQASYNYALHFVYPFQLFSPLWGYDPAVPGSADGMSFQLGVVPVILALAATVWVLRQNQSGGRRALILFFAVAALLLVLLMLPLSEPVWGLLPIASLVQFPWRLLALTAVALSILAGAAISRAQDADGSRHRAEWSAGQVALVVLVVVLASFQYTMPEYTPVPEIAEGPLLTIEFESKYTDMVGMTAWTQELPSTSPLVEQYRAGGPLVTAEALATDAQVEMIRAGGASDELWVRSEQGTALRFYTYYFPGWRVTIDGERLPETALRPETAYGLLTVDVPPGEHRVLLRWGDTPVRAVGKTLTLSCLALALILVWIKRAEDSR